MLSKKCHVTINKIEVTDIPLFLEISDISDKAFKITLVGTKMLIFANMMLQSIFF